MRGRRAQKGTVENEPVDHGLGRSRGGFGTKIHLVTDRNGVPIVAAVSAGQAHESKHFERTMELVSVKRPRGRERSRPEALSGDKAFSYPRVRTWLRRRGIRAVIPLREDQRSRQPHTDQAFDRQLDKNRNVIERCTGWLKESRRVVTRFDKLAVNYLTFIRIAMIERLLRIGLSDRA